MFGKLFGDKIKNAVSKYAGDKDFLEAMCAACALTAAAKGGIDEKEEAQTIRVIEENPNIAPFFTPSDIERTFAKMAQRVGTRSGRNSLKEEMRESISRDRDKGQPIMLAALDVADQGGIDPEEEVVLKDLCGICGVNYDKLLAG